MLSKLKSLWNKLPDGVKRVLHTFWQSFLGVFLLGITGVVSNLLSTHSLTDAKSALFALCAAAIAAALSAVKSKLASRS